MLKALFLCGVMALSPISAVAQSLPDTCMKPVEFTKLLPGYDVVETYYGKSLDDLWLRALWYNRTSPNGIKEVTDAFTKAMNGGLMLLHSDVTGISIWATFTSQACYDQYGEISPPAMSFIFDRLPNGERIVTETKGSRK